MILLRQLVNFTTWIPDFDTTVLVFWISIILATQKTSLHFKAEQKLLSFPSSHGLLLNGINLI